MSAVATPRKDRDTRFAAVARIEHPLLKRNYRIATTAIESMVHLVERCVRVLIPGALIYARPRMGKTHGVDYLCLHLARTRPDILAVRLSCEHVEANKVETVSAIEILDKSMFGILSVSTSSAFCGR